MTGTSQNEAPRCFSCGRPLTPVFLTHDGESERWLACPRWLKWWTTWFEWDHESRYDGPVDAIPEGARVVRSSMIYL